MNATDLLPRIASMITKNTDLHKKVGSSMDKVWNKEDRMRGMSTVVDNLHRLVGDDRCFSCHCLRRLFVVLGACSDSLWEKYRHRVSLRLLALTRIIAPPLLFPPRTKSVHFATIFKIVGMPDPPRKGAALSQG